MALSDKEKALGFAAVMFLRVGRFLSDLFTMSLGISAVYLALVPILNPYSGWFATFHHFTIGVCVLYSLITLLSCTNFHKGVQFLLALGGELTDQQMITAIAYKSVSKLRVYLMTCLELVVLLPLILHGLVATEIGGPVLLWVMILVYPIRIASAAIHLTAHFKCHRLALPTVA